MCCCGLRRDAAGAREAFETAVAVASADLLLRLEAVDTAVADAKEVVETAVLLLPRSYCWGARYRISSETA